MLKNYSINKVLVLLTTMGFLFLLIDTTIEHLDVFKDELFAYIPVIFCIFAVILGFVTFFVWKVNIIRIFKYFLFASIVVALLGTYFHVMEEEDDEDLTSVQREHEEEEGDKPLLAPLSFAGLAALGLIATSNNWKEEDVLKKNS